MPDGKRSAPRSSALSVPKRHKKESINPFDPDLTPEERLNAKNMTDECPICQSADFNYPVMACLNCKQPVCHLCLSEWSKTANTRYGDADEKLVACVVCRVNAGYKEHEYLTEKAGKKLQRCERCKDMISVQDLKHHVMVTCVKRKVTCGYSVYGCVWTGNQEARAKHEEGCHFQDAALAKVKIDEMKEGFKNELLEMRRDKDILLQDLESTIEKGRKELETLTKELASLQNCLRLGEVRMFTKGRRADQISIPVSSPNKKSLHLQVSIELDADKFYSLRARFTDDAARFPIWVSLFILNPSVPGLTGPCSQGTFFFRNQNDTAELYSELDSWDDNRELARSKRGSMIQFGIIGSMLTRNDPLL